MVLLKERRREMHTRWLQTPLRSSCSCFAFAVWCLHGDNKSCRCLHGPSHSPSNDGIYIRFLWSSLCRLPVCVYFFPIKVTLGCTARSKMLPRLCKKACMPSFSVSKPQDKINMLDEYIRGHDITL